MTTRPKSDSGLIDLIAMDRDARAAAAEHERKLVEARASERPITLDVGSPGPRSRSSVLDSSADLDALALSMASPWKRISRAKLAAGAGGVLLLLIGLVVVTSGGAPEKKPAAAATTTLTSPLPPSIPPPPPIDSLPAAPPAPSSSSASASATLPTTSASASLQRAGKGDKGRKVAAPKRSKGKSSGPKMTKVQSSGV